MVHSINKFILLLGLSVTCSIFDIIVFSADAGIAFVNIFDVSKRLYVWSYDFFVEYFIGKGCNSNSISPKDCISIVIYI